MRASLVLLGLAAIGQCLAFGCAGLGPEPKPVSRASESRSEPSVAAPERDAPSPTCAHPLELKHVRPSTEPPVVARARSDEYELIVTRQDAPNWAQQRPATRRSRFGLRLVHAGHTVREFVIGRDAGPTPAPSVAAAPGGEFFLAWPDRSSDATFHGASGGGSYTVLDEERFARIVPETEQLEPLLVQELPSPLPALTDLSWERYRRYDSLQLGYASGHFWAVTAGERGLVVWSIDAHGQLSSPRVLDPRGESPQVGTGSNGRLLVAYAKDVREPENPTLVPQPLVVLELGREQAFAGSTDVAPSFAALGLSSTDGSAWWLGAHAANWPEDDYRDLFYTDQDPQRLAVLRFPFPTQPVALPVTEVPPPLTGVQALETRLARSWTLDSAQLLDTDLLHGQLTRESGQFEFAITVGCEPPRPMRCQGAVVSRAMGGVGRLSLHDGELRLRNADHGFVLERVSASGKTIWSNPTDQPDFFTLSADATRVVVGIPFRGFWVYAAEDGRELFNKRTRDSGLCMTEIDSGMVLGHHDQESYRFLLLDNDFVETPVLTLRGSYYECALAPWSGGLLVATSFDNEPDSNLGAKVRRYERQSPLYWTRIAPYGASGQLLGVPSGMPGHLPVAWREASPGKKDESAQRGTHFVTALGTRTFESFWSDSGRRIGQPREVDLRYGDGTEPLARDLPTWDVWRGDDRHCDTAVTTPSAR